MNKKNVIKASSLAVAVALLSAGVGALVNEQLDEPVIVEKNVTVEVPVVEFVNVTKTVEVPVEKIVEVDNGDLAMVVQYLEDKEIFEDAKDVVAEIKAEDSAKEMAIELVKESFADELEDADIVGDEDEVELVKVYTDFEDIEIVESDFDDEEYKFVITAKVEDTEEEEKFKVDFTVEVEDGEVEIVKVVKQ